MKASTWVAMRQLERRLEIYESYDPNQLEYNDEVLLAMSIDEILEKMVELVRDEEVAPLKQRWHTRYQYLVSETRHELFRDWLRENDVPPHDALYIPMDERDRWRKIAGLGGYQKEQLIGSFRPEEIERLTR